MKLSKDPKIKNKKLKFETFLVHRKISSIRHILKFFTKSRENREKISKIPGKFSTRL
jgi:hypothetical protein